MGCLIYKLHCTRSKFHHLCKYVKNSPATIVWKLLFILSQDKIPGTIQEYLLAFQGQVYDNNYNKSALLTTEQK